MAIDGGQRLQARDLTVPGDVSSATFWIALAAGTPAPTSPSKASASTPRARRCSSPGAPAPSSKRGTRRGRGPVRDDSRRLRVAAQLRDHARRRARPHRRDPGARRPGGDAARRRGDERARRRRAACQGERPHHLPRARLSRARAARSRSSPTGSGSCRGRSSAHSGRRGRSPPRHGLRAGGDARRVADDHRRRLVGQRLVPGFFDALERLTR